MILEKLMTLSSYIKYSKNTDIYSFVDTLKASIPAKFNQILKFQRPIKSSEERSNSIQKYLEQKPLLLLPKPVLNLNKKILKQNLSKNIKKQKLPLAKLKFQNLKNAANLFISK